MNVELNGFGELEQLVKELGKVPQKVATKAARSGGQIELKAAKADAPVHDGWLKAALKLSGEKATKQGKKVYQITFDPAYNSKLVKFTKEGKRSYYPNSQEFGWKYPNGGYHVGLQYMRNSARAEATAIEQKMIDVAKSEIDKVLSTAR